MDEILFGEFIVTCHTEGCGNGEASITVSAPIPDEGIPVVVCGVCSKIIEDIVSV